MTKRARAWDGPSGRGALLRLVAAALLLCVIGAVSAAADDAPVTAFCQNWRVDQKRRDIDQSIHEREFDLKQTQQSGDINQNYNDPSGRIPSLAGDLIKARKRIAELRRERAGLDALPLCRPYPPPTADECFTDEARKDLERLKNLLGSNEHRLNLDKHQYIEAELDRTKPVPDPKTAAQEAALVEAEARSARTGAAARYDQHLIERLKHEIWELSHLPPCDETHRAQNPHDEQPIDSYDDQPEEPEEPPATTPKEPGAEERPEIGRKHVCHPREGHLCHVVRKHRAQPTEDSPFYNPPGETTAARPKSHHATDDETPEGMPDTNAPDSNAPDSDQPRSPSDYLPGTVPGH